MAKKRHYLVSIDEDTLRLLKEHYDVIEEQPGYTDEFFIWITLAQHPDGRTGGPMQFDGVQVRELTECVGAFNVRLCTWNPVPERPWEG